MRKNLVFTPLMVLIASGAVIHAQDLTTAALAGVVTNQAGQPLEGVRLDIHSPSLLANRTTSTDSRGSFRVSLLPNGTYSVAYSLSGYITRRQTIIIVAGQVANGSIRLTSVATREETVEIVANSDFAQIDKTDTIVQTAYSSEFLENVTGRDFRRIGRIAPGMSSTNPVSNSANYWNLRGGGGSSTRTMIDGASIHLPNRSETIQEMLPSGDLIESLAIIQSPLNARYGNTESGLVSIVQARGTNEFAGTLRWNIYRPSGWGTTDDWGYPVRGGRSNALSQPTNNRPHNNYNKNLWATITGPLWKNRLTFTYSGRIIPTGYNVGQTLWQDFLGNPADPQPYNRMGTFYQDPNGEVFRGTELYSFGTPYATRTVVQSRQDNRFAFYLQLHENHQLEYGHIQRINENGSNYVGAGNRGNIAQADNDSTGQMYRMYNLAYKGIIGKAGVLEARWSRASYNWFQGNPGGVNPDPIRTWAIGSYRPIDGNYNNTDLNNYFANGYLSAAIGTGNIGQFEQMPGTWATPPSANTGWSSLISNGLPVDSTALGDLERTDNLVLNYQHHLNTTMGSHLIDVGMTMDKGFGNKPANTNMTNWNAVGQISNSSPQYAGQYIVYNVYQATYQSLDPWAVSRYGLVNKNIYNQATGQFEQPFTGMNSYAYNNVGEGFAGPGAPVPYVYIRSGDNNGYFESNMTSFYINDLWTINNHHNLMVGMRLDNYIAKDSTTEYASYSKPTFRFEYKWDMAGDNSRVFNVSWAQFHQNVGFGPFGNDNMSPTAGARHEIRYWNAGSGTPYLVSKDQLMDLSNYGPAQFRGDSSDNVFVSDPNWRAPVSTEIAVGMTRNLDMGGYWKLTYINRNWENEWALVPGDIVTNAAGQNTFQRVLSNVPGYTRTYNSVEMEWNVPLHKRITFLGSYTFTRFFHNSPSGFDNQANWADGVQFVSWHEYWDNVYGDRQTWRPVYRRQAEHNLKAFLTFDVSSGKVKSNFTFDLQYTSGGVVLVTWNEGVGFPYQMYPGLITGPGGSSTGNGVAGTTGSSGMPNSVSVFGNADGSGNDAWDLTLRYTINVPITKKLSWFCNIDIRNPFNHRGISGWWSAGGHGGNYRPQTISSPSGTLWNYTNDYRLSDGRNLYRNGTGNYEGFYRSYQAGRNIPGPDGDINTGNSAGLSTGFRF